MKTIKLQDVKEQWLQNPAIKKEYNKLQPEFEKLKLKINNK
jgi:hypothetical protein